MKILVFALALSAVPVICTGQSATGRMRVSLTIVSPEEAEAIRQEKFLVCMKKVALFARPTPSSEIVGWAESGNAFDIIRKEGEWVEIRLSEARRAYIFELTGVVVQDGALSVCDEPEGGCGCKKP